MKEIKVEWCKNWIRRTFKKLPFENSGIEAGCFWEMAEKSELWVRWTYGSPMSQALEAPTKVEIIHDDSGKYLYSVFRLA